MNIGDLFFTFRGDGARLQKDAKTEGDKAGASMGKSIQAGLKKSWNGREIGKGLVQGLGLAGGLGAAVLVSRAIGKVTDFLGDSTRAAIAEEDSIASLDAQLYQSIKNWDGNRDAIERVLKSRMRLGFSDDEQRESLVRLLPVYKDVNRALEIQRAAMDLARFKKISLADATLELITIEAGQYRSLKKLIGSTKDITTSEQALAAVHEAVGDAAEVAAKKNSGKLLASQVKLDEAMEGFGSKTLPLVVEGLSNVANALDLVSGSEQQFASIGESISSQIAEGTVDGLRVSKAAIEKALFDLRGSDLSPEKQFLPNLFAGGQIESLKKQLAEVDQAIFDATDGYAQHTEDMREASRRNLTGPGGATVQMDKVAEASGEMADEIKKDTRSGAERFKEFRDALIADADALIGKAYDPIITHNQLVATNIEIAATKAAIASGKLKGTQLRDAHDTLDGLRKDQAEYVLSLAEAGQTQSGAYRTAMTELRNQIKNSTGPTKTYLQGVLDKIKELERVGASVPINFNVNGLIDFGKVFGGRMGKRAAGGPVQAGMPYIVGERRAEVFIPDVRGYVAPSTSRIPSLAAAGADAGGGDTNFTLNMPAQKAPDPFQTANALRRLADFGVLTPRKKR